MHRYYFRALVSCFAFLVTTSAGSPAGSAPEERRVFHILVPKRSEAVAIRGEITSGGESLSAFRAAARKHSKDVTTKFLGGDLGWFRQGAASESEFWDAAFWLAPGKVSEPFRGTYGWHLIYVPETRGAPSGEKAREAPPKGGNKEGDVAVPARDEAAVAIVERYLKACGGREAFAAIRDRTVSFRNEKLHEAGGSTVVEIRLFLKQGYKVREEWTVMDAELEGKPLGFVQGYDGTEGWAFMLGTVSSLDGKTSQVFVWDKELQDFFLHWEEDGYSLKKVGSEKLADEPVDLLEAKDFTGRSGARYAFSSKTGLLLSKEWEDSGRKIVQLLKDYRSVLFFDSPHRLQVPMKIEILRDGKLDAIRTFTAVSFNQGLADELFTRPKGKPLLPETQ